MTALGGRHPSQPAADVPHFIGYVETTTDALRLIMAARQGIIPRITRRLNDSERRAMIRSGAVFVFCVEESGIKRWTEGLSWSPSRIVGNFLMYREVGERNSNRGTDTTLLPPGTSTFRVVPPSTPASSYYPSHGRPDGGGARDPGGAMRPSGLIKKTITVKVSGTDHHLVSYYREEDVARGLLQRPTSRPDIMRLTIPPEMVRATNFRHPPHIEIGSDGIAHIYDAEEAESSRRPYERPLPVVASAPIRSAPSPPDQVSGYPIQQSEASQARYPASNFNPERPLSHHFAQVPSGHTDAARARTSTSYSWSPPSTPGHGDPGTPPPLGARSSQPWSSASAGPGAPLHEANPTPEQASYYTQPPQTQEHHPASASSDMNHHQRELYYPHAYTRAGAPGWSPRSPTSPDGAHRRISSAQPLGTMSQNQTQQQQQQPSYASSYMDGHRRGDYDGTATRGP